MKISRQLRRSMMAIAGVFLCCATTKSAQSTNAQPSQSEWIDGYRRAHEHRDLRAMAKLFCWDGVTADIRKIAEDHMAEMFDEKILSIRMTTEHPKDRTSRFIKNGVTYGLNLPVVEELLVESPPLPKATPERSYYPVGIKDGHFLISLMAPVTNTGAERLKNSNVQASRATTESAHAVSIARAGQQALVPAKASLTMRLNQEVGMRTITTGGTFSAIFSEPVEVNGVTVIPAGATAEGSVTKSGAYSPEMTLTSVIVNGKPHSVKTASITFNEQISFPAGSEVTFHLIWPMK